jgi:tetratricopeptide (TPR) repeat protein
VTRYPISTVAVAALLATALALPLAAEDNRSGAEGTAKPAATPAAEAPATPAAEAPASEELSQVDGMLLRAFDHFQAARYDSALQLYSAAIRLAPEDERAYRGMIAGYAAKDEIWAASRYFQALVRLVPFKPAPHAALGEIELLREQPERAVPYFEKAIRQDARHPASLAGLARARCRSGDTEMILAHFDKLLAARPTEPSYRYGKAVALTEQKEYKAAATQYKWAIRLDEHNWQAERDYARMLAETGTWDLSVKHYRRAVELLEAMRDPTTAAGLAAELAEVEGRRIDVPDDAGSE